jgi:hypothetical protein
MPAACDGLAETSAAYHFYDNNRVDDYELLPPPPRRHLGEKCDLAAANGEKQAPC